MRIRTFFKPLSFLPAILLMYIIFTFSAQEGDVSASISYKASTVIVRTADHIFDMGLDDYQISFFATKIHGVTRKLAHMGEYFLLAIAVSFPFYVYGLHGILLMILAGGICVAFACGDEYHQSFVAGRAASMKDVGIDSFGVFMGILLVRIIGWTGRMTIFRPRRNIPDTPKLTRREKKWLRRQMAAPQGMPYPEEYYTNASRQNIPSQNVPYPNTPQPNGAYPNDPRRNSPYPAPPYQEPPYTNPPYPNGPQHGYPYSPAPPGGYGQSQQPYMAPPEHSSDELSEDMPFSHLLKPRK